MTILAIQVSDEDRAIIRIALRQRMASLMNAMRYVKGEYNNVIKEDYATVRKLYLHFGGISEGEQDV